MYPFCQRVRPPELANPRRDRDNGMSPWNLDFSRPSESTPSTGVHPLKRRFLDPSNRLS
jgi:hypothetical protein